MFNYTQALERMEKFMLESGIRHYCTNICKGQCCGTCYTSNNACHKNEGRRLKCSWFICVFMAMYTMPGDLYEKYRQLGSEISDSLSKASMNMYKNPYYVPYDDLAIKAFRIDAKHFENYLPDASIVRDNIIKLFKSNKHVKHMSIS